MRSNWLYLAMRSVREAEPVLICPVPAPTARSAINVSSVSPERGEATEEYPLRLAHMRGFNRSPTGPILLVFTRTELATISSVAPGQRPGVGAYSISARHLICA